MDIFNIKSIIEQYHYEILKIQQQNFSRIPFSTNKINKNKTIIKKKFIEYCNNNINLEDEKRYERRTFNAKKKQKFNIMMDEDFVINNNIKKNIEQKTDRKTYTNLNNYENLSNKCSKKNNNEGKDYINVNHPVTLSLEK